ncbi:hypothetical protein QW180_02580 [Vibrio sinaloensis]|nr:hypothetical protein [Vibrio sinaloensis]
MAALPLIAFFSVKAAKNRSLKEASQSVINLTMFSAGIIRGFFHKPKKDPKVAPENKIIKASE